MSTDRIERPHNRFQPRWAVAGAGLVAAYLIARDHWAHVADYLPYLVILACPLAHFFMHRGAGHGQHEHDRHNEKN